MFAFLASIAFAVLYLLAYQDTYLNPCLETQIYRVTIVDGIKQRYGYLPFGTAGAEGGLS